MYNNSVETHSKNLIVIILTTIFSSLLFWLIFATNIPPKIGFPDVSMETIFANYDGPNYIIAAKCLYDKECIGTHYSLPQPLEYYPAHLPGYPFLIRYFNLFISGPWSMLLVTLLGSIYLNVIFYKLANKYFTPSTSLLLTLILNFFPARLFVLRQVGAPETWFLATTITSIYYFKDKKYLLSAAFAALAQTLKSPGILLLVAYFIFFIKDLYQSKKYLLTLRNYLPFALVPAIVLLIFMFYYRQTGDFLAYFHSGDNFHLNLLPYQVFVSTKSWINTIWLEDVIYIYFFLALGIYKLFSQHKNDPVSVYSLVFLMATILVAHRDISRYAAPIYPFLLLAFGNQLTRKPILTILILLLPAIILYSVNFVIGNTAPIADWTNYL